jgi:outer membrane protein assembly factor BamB
MNAVRLLFVSIAIVCVASAQEWTRFRGPNGDGISHAKTIPTQWTADDYNWVVDLPAGGSSSPVIWGERIFLTGSDKRSGARTVFCVSTQNGEILWRREFPGKRFRMHRDNDFAAATPTVDKDGVVVVWASPEQLQMVALDLDGRDMWLRKLGPFPGMHGSAASPIIVDDKVVLANDQMSPVRMARYLPRDASRTIEKSFLIAVDRQTGLDRWRVDRKTDLSGYATPTLRQVAGGRPELIFSGTAHGITAVDVETGRVNWEIDKIFDDRTVSSPQLYKDLVFASHGAGLSGERFVAVRPETKDGKIVPSIVWEVKTAVPLVPTSLVKDDLIFLWSDHGTVTCLDAGSGEPHWRERVGGRYYCSPIWIDKRLYCVSRDGKVRVIAADKTFQSLATIDLGDDGNAVPAISGGVMYIRTQNRLFSLGGN